MSLLTDIIIADRSEAAAINAAGGRHHKKWKTLDGKDVDQVKLGTLAQILAGKTLRAKNVAAFVADKELHGAPGEGPWVYLVPADFVQSLAALSERDKETVAARWAATEEFQLDGWAASDVADYLHELVAYARQSQKLGKDLLMWICL